MPLKLIYFFIDYLKAKNVLYLVAPHEADFQLAQMYKKEKVDYIWSEDSDILVYDCQNIIKGLKMEGDCQILNKRIFEQFRKKVERGKDVDELVRKRKAIKFMDFTPEEKIKVAVYSGCDYLESVRGLGFGTVIDYLPHREKDLLKKIKQQGKNSQKETVKIFPSGISCFKEYQEAFEQVVESFEHQIYFEVEIRENELTVLSVMKGDLYKKKKQ